MRYLHVLLLLLTILPICAAEKAPLFPVPQIPFKHQRYICYRPLDPVVIDGRLDDIDWNVVPWTTPFVDIVSKDMPKPRFETRAKMLWDNDYLYIAAEMEEPDLWATLTQRDAVIFHDNDFEVFIDPDGDTHNYYELEINALNTVWDLFLLKSYRDGDKVALDSWDIQGLKTAVHLNGTLNDPSDRDKGWTVEIAIPWKAIGQLEDHYPPRDGDIWCMNFSRVEWKHDVIDGQYVKSKDDKGNPLPEDNWVWSPQGLVAMHYPEMWGNIEFSRQNLRAEGVSVRITMGYDDEVKDYLRKVYYKEKEYYLANGKYDPNPWHDLKFTFPPKIKKPTKPVIEITSRSYIAHFSYPGEKRTWYTNQEGRTWVEENK
ncbi:MAG TPA: carbohydrate-binding family 9-like protein [Candidatus Cloacimonadota bacterium]|nr:carbohydrate-binding family 9-like protein [Candidatus Cloacimonadota bacterium]HPT70996.1 carbohydrate-binding family 9-like protein [Candidatus Cloacimonadota bacterium]